MKIHAIANLENSPDEEFFSRIQALSSLEVDFIQLRARTLPARELLRIAGRCRELISAPATAFVVNSRADVAAAVGAEGVHLPAAGLPVDAVRNVSPGLIIGRSCHSVRDCVEAARSGADYVLLGPVFDPRSKAGKGSVSLAELQEAASSFANVFALGGISRDNLEKLEGIPVAGIAAITLFMSDEPLAGIVEAVRRI